MEKFKYCSNCGFKMLEEDRFCSNCGFDTLSGQQEPKQEVKQEPKREAPRAQGANINAQDGQGMGPNQNMRPNMNPNAGRPGPGAPKNSNTGLIIAISATVVLLLLGGGIYAALSMRSPKEKPPVASNPQQEEQENGSTEGNSGEKTETEKPEAEKEVPAKADKPDLMKAATYLSKPGLKATFYVNYPDGMAGVVERTSSDIAPDPSVIVTEVETGTDMGEEFGFATHYVERADGTYLIYDDLQYELTPVMKNGLYVGHTWDYWDEYGGIVWTVVEMGVDLDMGFKVFEDCIVIEEDNQAVGFQSLTYYAPGYGIVRVVDPSGGTEYYRMTEFEEIGAEEASQPVKKWAPNYMNIKDDSTQTY